MKKYMIYFCLMSVIFLSGCGFYNLSHFVLPDDSEFIAIIEKLDTPQKIAIYMKENFTYKVHLYYAPNPYIFWKLKEGDCNDYATFGIFVANYHEYETYHIIIGHSLYKHFIAIYMENDELSITDNYVYCYGYNSFLEIVNMYDNWKSYKVYDYEMNVIEEKIKQERR